VQDEAHYHLMCRRLRAGWTRYGGSFTYPPATEEQVQATEAQLGFSLPPLLRLLYREVANGGNGLVCYDEQFPFFGVEGGCACRELINGTAETVWHTIGELVGRSGWQLHPAIAEALCRYPSCFVICDQLPDRFIPIHLESLGLVVLDPQLGYLYEVDYETQLPLENNETVTLLSVQFYKRSLEDWLEEWLQFLEEGTRAAVRVSEGATPGTEPALSRGGRHELTPELLDPAWVTDQTQVWHGLYRGLAGLLPDSEEPWGT
jgi:hypothetical protein